jgi:hypothetical protein
MGAVESVSSDDSWAVWIFFAELTSLPPAQQKAAMESRTKALDRCSSAAMLLPPLLADGELYDGFADPTYGIAVIPRKTLP